MNQIIFDVNENNIRIDKFLASSLEDFTRSRIQKLIDEGCVTINDRPVKANYKVKSGERVAVQIPDAAEIDVAAEEIPLDIVYEDDCMLVVNKPQGMVVHPAAGNYSGTLVNALLSYCPDSLSGINGEKRPGILHRIDKDTSGLLLVAKNDIAHKSLSEQIKAHSLTREYRALVHGNIKEDEGTINAPIGRHPVNRKKMAITEKNSREAITHFKVLERFPGFTYVSCRLETGRTHQIRVHLSSRGHSIVGDKTYGVKDKFGLEGQLLHACRVGFIHPISGEYMEFMRDVPDYFEKVLLKLRRMA
ncbi:MAG: RluA family pseudouridine synthase [Clostridia bacterium]|nr:RluA family pseudouridine synthase [Clostridia bacterium]